LSQLAVHFDLGGIQPWLYLSTFTTDSPSLAALQYFVYYSGL